MCKIIIITLLTNFAVPWFGLSFTDSVFAVQLSEIAREWDDKISNNPPSKPEDQSLPSLRDGEKDVQLTGDEDYRMLQEKHRLWLLIAIVISTPILLIIILLSLKKAPDCSGESLVNVIGLVLVIEGTMFIAVSAVTTEQLTAPIGILGAIAGYLFGSAQRKTTKS